MRGRNGEGQSALSKDRIRQVRHRRRRAKVLANGLVTTVKSGGNGIIDVPLTHWNYFRFLVAECRWYRPSLFNAED